MARTSSIKNLKKARKAKNDEFYTQYIDIQKEIEKYLDYNPDTFRNKVVYCNCDDPFESNFFRYFVLNFNKLGLKQLITTSYKPSPVANTQLALFGDDKTLVKAKGRPKITANKFIVQGTSDEQLVTAVKPVAPGSGFTIPKYDYQLTFTDINDNEFDEKGRLVNRDVINMNWTLENYCGEVHYKFWPCLIQKAKISDSKFMFEIKTLFHWFGMESIGDSIYKIGTNFEK